MICRLSRVSQWNGVFFEELSQSESNIADFVIRERKIFSIIPIMEKINVVSEHRRNLLLSDNAPVDLFGFPIQSFNLELFKDPFRLKLLEWLYCTGLFNPLSI